MILILSGFYKTTKFTAVLVCLLLVSCASQQPPTLIPFADGEYWVLGNDLVFTIRQTDQRIVVPRGFVTDFASVPRVFWTFFPKHGEYTRAAIVHDFLYWEQKCSRQQADELFDIVMEDSEVDSTTRFSIYAAVRVWGGEAWEENAARKQQGYVRIIPEQYVNFPIKTRWHEYREYLLKMRDVYEPTEEFPSSDAPAYCRALQEKEAEPEEAIPQPVQQKEAEPEEAPLPETRPVPESAIGA